MKVKKLVEILNQINLESEVYYADENDLYYVINEKDLCYEHGQHFIICRDITKHTGTDENKRGSK